ncbi:HAD family hydrolase [Paenibacillus sp. MBLB4367]|uniref:HAD family hydrolase n=1 Tax=Paenibacillus sp. MBLB4367 TaxID=3384767 RepID=UPI003907FAED
MYKAIIFDMDNTLVNYEVCELQSMRLTCERNRLFDERSFEWERFWPSYLTSNAVHWESFVTGGGVKTIGEVLANSFRDTLGGELANPDELARTYWEHFCQMCVFEEGADRLLEDIAGIYKLGIITNGISESQRARLKAGNIYDRFDSIVISDEVGFRKPSKAIFDIALRQLQADSHEVLFVGDSLRDDYAGAVNAGIDFCYYNRNGTDVPGGMRPKFVLDSMSEFKRIFG